jgi:hypothetical protein
MGTPSDEPDEQAATAKARASATTGARSSATAGAGA